MVFVTAAIVGAGLIANEYSKYRARKGEKRARRLKQRQAASQVALERRQMARQARLQQARIEAAAAASGTQGSSVAAGAQGAIGSQLAFNMAQSKQGVQLSKTIGDELQSSANWRAAGGTIQGIANVAASFYGLGQGGGGAQ